MENPPQVHSARSPAPAQADYSLIFQHNFCSEQSFTISCPRASQESTHIALISMCLCSSQLYINTGLQLSLHHFLFLCAVPTYAVNIHPYLPSFLTVLLMRMGLHLTKKMDWANWFRAKFDSLSLPGYLSFFLAFQSHHTIAQCPVPLCPRTLHFLKSEHCLHSQPTQMSNSRIEVGVKHAHCTNLHAKWPFLKGN